MELVGVAHVRGRLGSYPLDGVRVEPAQLSQGSTGRPRRSGTARDRRSATLLCPRFEKRERGRR